MTTMLMLIKRGSCRAQQNERHPKLHWNLHKSKKKKQAFNQNGRFWRCTGIRQQLQSEKHLKKKEKSETTKIAVNQEEQSADRTFRGNKRGADYLQSLPSGSLMLNQFNKRHLFRLAVVSASRGNLQSLQKMCFLRFHRLGLGVCYTICHGNISFQLNTPKSSIK